MGYPRDLDEIPELDLKAEIIRRTHARAHGRCDYCGRDRKESPCKFPDRHDGREEARQEDSDIVRQKSLLVQKSDGLFKQAKRVAEDAAKLEDAIGWAHKKDEQHGQASISFLSAGSLYCTAECWREAANAFVQAMALTDARPALETIIKGVLPQDYWIKVGIRSKS